MQAVAIGEAAAVEVLLHGVTGGEQADGADAGRFDAKGCRVGDVQQRNVDRVLNVVGEAVHRVRAQDQTLGTRALHAASEVREPPRGSFQSPPRWSASIDAKSTLHMTQSAECSPPSRSRTVW